MLPVFPTPSNHSKDDRPPGTVVRLDVYSHHVKVTGFGRPVKDALLSFCRTLAQYGLKKVGRRFIKAMTRVFVGVTSDRRQFNFHINEMDRLINHLGNAGIAEKQIHIVHHGLYEPLHVEYDYIDERDPRDYQVPIIKYIKSPGKIKVVTLDPGRGKTFIALSAIRDMKVRVFFCIKAMYIEKWVSDVEEAFKLKKGELLVVKGTKSLQDLMRLAEAGELEAKIILCSNTTFQLFLKTYEIFNADVESKGYPFSPEVFFEKLKVGLRVVDETHETAHFNYRLDCYSHVPKILGLSGTLTSDDPFMNQVYETMFPEEIRYNDNDRHVYMTVDALMYRMPDADNRISFINHALKSYSHIRFEQSIMKRKRLTEAYVEMVADIVLKRFVEKREVGQKMVIYFATVDFCTIMAEELKRRHRHLEVTRYVSEDDYAEMLKCDIIVSTLKSLGTAIDVPGLRVALLTDALGSKQANLQCSGRLRFMKDWPDVSPEFLYLVCEDIEKHLDYHYKKQKIFQGRVVAHHVTSTAYEL